MSKASIVERKKQKKGGVKKLVSGEFMARERKKYSRRGRKKNADGSEGIVRNKIILDVLHVFPLSRNLD